MECVCVCVWVCVWVCGCGWVWAGALNCYKFKSKQQLLDMASAFTKLGALSRPVCRLRLYSEEGFKKCFHNGAAYYYSSCPALTLTISCEKHSANNYVVSFPTNCRRFLSATGSKFSSITRFVPLSSKTLFKKLVQDIEKSDVTELGLFEKFAFGVNHIISNTNYSHLPEMKLLYDPLNPDNTTLASRAFTSKELLDREFWFLQKFSYHLDKAGFTEIDKGDLLEMLAEKPVGKGVIADVKTDKFEILRFWVLGDIVYAPSSSSSSSPSYLNLFLGEQTSRKLYKRVIVASRLKNEKKLSLKLYKDIPANTLHLLLPPSGGLRMHPTYRNLILYSASLSAFFLFSRYAVMWMFGENMHLGYLPISFSAFFGIAGVTFWTLYKQRQKRYLTDVLDVVYDHFVIGNQNILPVVMDKCHEELLKGVLLSYHFLSTSAQDVNTFKDSSDKLESLTNKGSGVTKEKIDQSISKWLESATGRTDIKFNSSESIKWLSDIGILSIDQQTGTISVLPLSAAIKLLPVNDLTSSSFPSVRVDEFDLFHGDLAEATNLERKDLVDSIISNVWGTINRLQRRY
ncbi:hypothetical protein HELRODRAFT_167362 [Helobdella robusta]|uniref:Uncharacterized protein n=1 Tax=Helobdella robusta TaxID=6412 RepID=T1EZB0_HELRO|nr:hypothetical protein HELRODRAFT_167362 [Helobdella robusta]ESO10858.1 hypothetical protein HELRODRAFT_167362 [Helobdella robusta]